MRRVLLIIALVLLSFLLQTVIFPAQNLMSSSPDLMLVVTMSFGIMRGRREGMLTGLLSGFLMDTFYGNFYGIYMLIYMLVGYMNGFFHRNYLMEDVLLPAGISMVDCFFMNFVIWILNFLLRNRLNFGYYFVHVILPELLYTTLLTVVLYRILLHLNRYLKKKASKSRENH